MFFVSSLMFPILYLSKIDCQFISLCFSCTGCTSTAKAESILGSAVNVID